VKYREVARRLRVLGCEEIPRSRPGSPRIWYNPKTERVAPVPDWGPKDIKIGTLRAVVRQLDLGWKDFLEA
jgi:predicted RNA binding protein YcfA (HicA-like mRNA interferase family)